MHSGADQTGHDGEDSKDFRSTNAGKRSGGVRNEGSELATAMEAALATRVTRSQLWAVAILTLIALAAALLLAALGGDLTMSSRTMSSKAHDAEMKMP